MVSTLVLVSVLATGTVTLHVTDVHGKPLASRDVWLAPTNSTKALRPFGVQWWVPDSAYHGRTDASGKVAIKGVPKNKPMMVVARFGPRFDAYVAKQSPHYFTMDIMKFEGAVYAGRSARAVVADDYAVFGRVTNAETGAPLANVPVTLSDTGFGHMSGYPGTDIDATKTDAVGNYRFTRLPNCAFRVAISLGRRPNAIEARVAGGPWTYISVYVDPDHWEGTDGQGVNLDVSRKRCDFRVSSPAEVTVRIVPDPLRSLKGWSVFVGKGYWGHTLEDGKPFTINVLAGTHDVWLMRESDGKHFTAGKVTVRPGERRTVEYSFADIVGGKRAKD